MYYLSNNQFPEVKGKFKEFFTIHPATHKTWNLMTIGCIICLMQTLTNMKQGGDVLTLLLPWLHENHIFIAVASLVTLLPLLLVIHLKNK